MYSQTTSEIPPLSTVKYVVDQNLKKGEKVLSTSGNWGYEASAWRDFVKDGEVIRTETLPSSYYGPSGTIYRIGPGTETSSPSPTPTATPTGSAHCDPCADGCPDCGAYAGADRRTDCRTDRRADGGPHRGAHTGACDGGRNRRMRIKTVSPCSFFGRGNLCK